MIIDFHNHYFPPQYLDAIRTGGSHFRVTEDDEGNPVLHSPGDYNVLVPGHRDLAFRAKVLDEAGVDKQVLTFTAPGTSIETPDRAVELSRVINDAFASDVAAWNGRYTALAHLPMNAPDAAAAEATRAVEELGLPGVMLLSNASGVPLSDDRFLPVFEALNRAEAVVYIHPTYPVGVEVMEKYMLMPMVGFLMDTTLATASLVYAGVVERFDRGFEAYPECRERCTVLPSEQLKAFYYDTVNFDPACQALALGFAGPDHIVAGSDYPHMIGSLSKMVASIDAMDISDEDRQRVRGGNAARILGLI